MNTADLTTAALTARILAALADELDLHATITHPVTGTPIDQCMTQGRLDSALWATAGTLDRTPNRKRRDEARAAARAMLPPITGTVAEYVNQLRAVAA